MKNDHVIVIPCFNEEKRLPIEDYDLFLKKNEQIFLCIVNDGSIDKTSNVLEKLKSSFPSRIQILTLNENQGKGNAIFYGFQHVFQSKSNIKDIGYLDSDLSVSLVDYLNMLQFHRQENNSLTYASREKLKISEMQRQWERKLVSFLAKKMISGIFRLNIYDTQCGAKIFDIKHAKHIFYQQFESRWLFDIEIFIRIKETQQLNTTQPYYLKSWLFQSQSKMGYWDLIYKIPKELIALIWQSRFLKSSSLAPK